MKKAIHFIALTIVIALTAILSSGCQKEDGPENLRRGGNGNSQAPYTQIYTAPTNWNITFDTSSCGTFRLNWDAQAGAPFYTVEVVNRPANCAASTVYTNQWYYIYGYGCSMIVAHNYNIQLSYFIKDDVNKITTHYYSDTVQVRTGSRGLWNCN